jgi:hypothetical protein
VDPLPESRSSLVSGTINIPAHYGDIDAANKAAAKRASPPTL